MSAPQARRAPVGHGGGHVAVDGADGVQQFLRNAQDVPP